MKTKFRGILTLLLALVVQISFAQQKTVTGTVSDDSGLPLPGATIVVKGTSNGVQTDFDGNYSISVESGETLRFSYVGFEAQEVKVGASNTISLALQPGAELDEVVVTGYSRRNQTTQTSAVVSISASEIAELSPVTSVDNLLQGKAAGVQVTSANGKPGQGAFVRIRGTGSLNAGAASPLYIIDGAPIREEELSNIANEDIENITILKDAATTARYGSRGANGVVVITTKKGNRNKDAVVRVSSRYGVTSIIDQNYTLMNIDQKLQFESELGALGVGGLPGASLAPGSPERANFVANAVGDWPDLVLKQGIIQNNNMSFSGGAENVDYFFSAGFDRNTGIIDKVDGFERLNTRLNVNFDAKEWLELGVNVGYTRSRSDEPRDRNNSQNPFRHMLDVNPYESEFLYDGDGNIILDDNGNPTYNATTAGYPVRGALETEPAFEIENQTLASVNTLIKFTPEWSYGFKAAVSHLNRRTESYSQPGGILDAILQNNGNKSDTGTQRLDLTLSNTIGYNLRTDDHSLNVLGLFEYNVNEINFYRLRSIGFPSVLLSTQSNGATVLGDQTDTQRSRLTLVSYGAFADYDFKEKYLASASIRTDGSSSFGRDVQFGTFYSASLGWNLAKENFFAVDAINDLKFRASYGSVGNRLGIGRYEPLDTVEFSTYPEGPGTATVPSNVGNPDLQWETSFTTNIGMELNMFNRRLRGVFDYFKRDTEDLLFAVPRAAESGISSVSGNLGKITNSGLELSLSGDILRSEDLKWTVGANILIQLDSKIVELPDGEDVTPPADAAFFIRYSEGRKINEHYLIRYAGVDPDTGAPLYLGADGVAYRAEDLPEGENRVFQGKSTIAEQEGGFFSNINYKGFGLRTDFVFKAGNWVNNFVKSNLVTGTTANQAVGAFNYWQQPGDTNVLPSPLYRNDDPGAASDQFLEKGDYIRMRNATISYTVPNVHLEKTPFNSFRVYVTGQNLLTFTNFFGDPEVGLSSGETIAFADVVAPGEATLYSYPNTKSFQLGLDVSF